MEFVAFPKLARLSRDMIVTEKLDGTNAQVTITPAGEVLAGSRNRWVTPEQDNYGFARWVAENADALRALGEGTHYGEWWGAGIQRRYGLTEKRFSLFNVGRWTSPYNVGATHPQYPSSVCTACPIVHVVPILCRSTFNTPMVDQVLDFLVADGSVAAPGFMQPEGVVVFHAASGQLFKKTLDKNDDHKGAAA